MERAVQIQAERDFVEIVYARFRRLVRHGRALRRNGLDVLGDAQGGRFGNGFRQFARRRQAFGNRPVGFGEPGQLGRFAAEALHGGLLFAGEAFLAQLQLVEVDQVAVEIRAVHAGELHVAAHRDAAGPAHSGAIHHDRIEADDGRNAGGPRDFAARLHHRDGPDGDHFADVLFVGQHVGQRVGDEAVAAVAAIVGGDDQFVAALAELLFPEHQVAIAEADDGDGPVPRLLVGAQLGIDGRDAESAAHQHHGAFQLADMARQTQRADEIEDRVALAQRQHFKRGFAHGLDHDGDRAVRHVEIRHGQRDALPMLVDASHDKVSGTCRPRHIRRFHVPEEGCRTELFPTTDEKHHTP